MKPQTSHTPYALRLVRLAHLSLWKTPAFRRSPDLAGRIFELRGQKSPNSRIVDRAVVLVSEIAPSTRPLSERTGAAMQMMPGSCSSRS